MVRDTLGTKRMGTKRLRYEMSELPNISYTNLFVPMAFRTLNVSNPYPIPDPNPNP